MCLPHFWEWPTQLTLQWLSHPRSQQVSETDTKGLISSAGQWGWSLQEEALAVFCGLTDTPSGNFLGAPVHVPPSSNPGEGNFLNDQDLPWPLKVCVGGRAITVLMLWLLRTSVLSVHMMVISPLLEGHKLLTVSPFALGC